MARPTPSDQNFERNTHTPERPSSPTARRGPSPALARFMAKKTPQIEDYFAELLAYAGVQVDGRRPWDMRVHDRSVFSRILTGGSLALGESYMAGAWDCDQLDEFFTRILSARLEEKAGRSARQAWLALKARAANMQNGRRAYVVGQRHYDLGNDFFRAMLDSRMTYSCGYWHRAETLEDAQEAKLDLICRKIGLKEGDRVLDIGCGWGSFAGYAAEHYGAEVVGVTVSREQARLANDRYADLPVEIRVQDYREVEAEFDHVISVGMFEHVGYKNYRTYMEVVDRCLKSDGNFLLHTIGGHTSRKSVDPWIEKYIFPNSMLPSANQITEAAEGLFVMRDWHTFGRDYDPTLMAWHERFEQAWPHIRKGLDEEFYRMWRYYLLACAGSFRADQNQVWQVLFSKPGNTKQYVDVR